MKNVIYTAGKLYRTVSDSIDAASVAHSRKHVKDGRLLMFYEMDVPVGTILMCVKSGTCRRDTESLIGVAQFLYREHIVYIEVFNNLLYPLEEILVSEMKDEER